jgi:hypothetical protein
VEHVTQFCLYSQSQFLHSQINLFCLFNFLIKYGIINYIFTIEKKYLLDSRNFLELQLVKNINIKKSFSGLTVTIYVSINELNFK